MNNKLAGKHIPYHPFIDGLRALAVLAVVFFHLNSNLLPGGFVGVDVFFVISGFIVSASVAAFKGATILQFFAIFYSRRIKRIFPALIFMLLVVFLLSTAFIPGSWLSWVNQSTGYYAFFGFSNFILASTGRDYFAPTTDFNPFTHTWSLGVEEQFYLIFPFLYIFWLSSKKRYLSSVIYLCLGVASLVYSFKLSATEPTQAYYFTASRFWELASGVLLYQFMSAFRQQLNSQHRVIWFRRIISVISLAGLLISFIITDTNRFPMPGALLATVSTLGLLFSLYDGVAPSIVNSLLSNRFLRFIGKLSFSLYLWHWPVFVLFRWTYGLEKNSQQLLALLIAVLFSLFSYLVIEKPVRNARFIAQRNNWIVLFTGVVVIGISYLAAAKIDSRVGKISQSVLTKFPQDWYPEGSGVVEGYPGCQAEPEHVDVNGGLLLIYKVKGCDKPASPNPHQIFVIGDSHALAYSGLFKSFAIKTQTTIFAYNNGGCPFLSFTPERDMDVPQCQKYSDSSLQDIIKRVKPGDILFLASLRLPRFVDQWAYFGDRQHADILFSERAEKGRERTVDYAKEALKPFVDKGVHIIFEAPKPLFKIPVYRCADWFNKSNPICKGGYSISREVIENYRAPILASYSELGKTIPLDVWDPLPTLCGESKCSAYKNGKPLFFD
ncbi:acyltransferase [Pantoea agglomerans]|uniref:acyltransferase family protein n=1 Tax=Enterobacter agglomerans TaxID=549 RepID=UPI0027381739|nr:acyltransferase family protein [Pantoea agglomerans]WLO85875.1 acyltransferase [Pantoea agglomerans]